MYVCIEEVIPLFQDSSHPPIRAGRWYEILAPNHLSQRRSLLGGSKRPAAFTIKPMGTSMVQGGISWLVGGFNHLETYESQWEG